MTSSTKRIKLDVNSSRLNSLKTSPKSPKVKKLHSEVLINEFRNLYYECKESKIGTQNVDLGYSSLSALFENGGSSKDEKMVIAFFGGSGLHKSSSINFLLCGDFDFPLPNSDTSGRGVTKTPIRCEYHNERHNDFILKLYVSDRLEIEETLNHSKLKDRIDRANETDQYDEILLQVPIVFKPTQSPFADNIQFLDLIGTEVNMDAKSLLEESPSVKKNRDAIRKNEVHSVFIFSKERGKCTTEIIRHLWDIDVFSNLKDKCKPKLVMFDIVQAWRKTEQEIESNFKAEGLEECTKSLQVSLLQAFDFDIDPNAERNKTLESKFELPLMHKSAIIPELYKNCTTCFLLEKSGHMSEKSHQVLEDLVESILKMILNNKKLLILESAAKMIVELRQKLKAKLNTQMNDLTRALIRFFDTKKYAKLKSDSADQIDSIVDTFQDYVLHRDIMEPMTELNDNGESKQYKWNSYEAVEFRINEIYEEFIMDLVFYFMDYKKRLDEAIRSYLTSTKNDQLQFYIFSDFNAEYFSWRIENVLKDALKNEISKFTHDKIKFDEPEKSEILCKFNSAREKIKQAIDMKECIVDSSADNSNTAKLTCLEEKSKLLKENINAKLSDLVGHDSKFKHEHYEIREPCLYFSPRTLRFPSVNSPCDSLDTCSQSKWIQVPKNDAKAVDLFVQGRLKSKIFDNQQFVHLEFSEKFRSECAQLGLDTAVQIHIDRLDKKVVFEYDSIEINNRIDNLLKCVDCLDSDGLATHLHPIFMSSVQRDSQFTPNLLVKDLCNSDSSIKNFVIFLFIEAGSSNQRFDQTIQFYTHLTSFLHENSAKKMPQNPFVMCFLPEQNLGIGRKRKLMMLFAEWLNLNRFYLCDDDIEHFYIYDPRPQFRMCRNHQLAASKAFAYMSHVMDCALQDKDIDFTEANDPLTRQQIIKFIKKLGLISTNNEDARDSIETILFEKSYLKQKDYLFFLLGKLGHEAKEIEQELKDLLLNEKAKVLGQIGLWNQNANSMRSTFTSRLQGNNRTTHAISKIRYQLVLFNMHAMSGIHPVSDDVLFEMPLTKQERDKLCSKIENKNFDNKEASRAARLGYRYSDKAHVYYQILNRVTGYLVFYFSFTSLRNIPSLVNGKKNQ